MDCQELQGKYQKLLDLKNQFDDNFKSLKDLKARRDKREIKKLLKYFNGVLSGKFFKKFSTEPYEDGLYIRMPGEISCDGSHGIQKISRDRDKKTPKEFNYTSDNMRAVIASAKIGDDTYEFIKLPNEGVLQNGYFVYPEEKICNFYGPEIIFEDRFIEEFGVAILRRSQILVNKIMLFLFPYARLASSDPSDKDSPDRERRIKAYRWILELVKARYTDEDWSSDLINRVKKIQILERE